MTLRRVRMLLRSALFALLLAVPPVGHGQTPPTEYELKAVFLLNFARYVEWPDATLPAGRPLSLCVLGRDPFGDAFALLAGKQAQGRAVQVRRLAGPEEAEQCHVLFIAASEARGLAALLRELAGRPILTVSDIGGFVEAGGAIGLVNLDDRIGFDINQASLQQDRLKARSQLLRLARRLLGTRSQ